MNDKLRVLIIEDDAALREVSVSALADQCSIESASSTAMALAVVETFHPHVIIFDSQISGEDDSFGFLEKVREIAGEALVLVITSKVTTPDYVLKAMRYGAYDCMERPITLGSMTYAVQRAANFRKLQRENAQRRMEVITAYHDARQLYEQSGKGGVVALFWKDDISWGVYAATSNITDLLGYTVEDCLSGQVTFKSMIHEDDWPDVETQIKTNVRVRGITKLKVGPYRMKKLGGENLLVENTLYVYRDGKGFVRHFESILATVN